MLQILDEGILTDSNGVKVNFGNCIIILTSNSLCTEGSHQLAGFCKDDSNREKEIATKSLSRELADRIDEVVVFKRLSLFDLEKIASIQSKMLSDRRAHV